MKRIIAEDTLPIHYTTLKSIYEVLDEDEECYKIQDDRGRINWVPRRYFLEFEDSELKSDD